MGPYRLRYLKTALDDLKEIQNFNLRFSLNYQDTIIAKMRAYCQSLALNPYRAAVYEYDTRYRKAVVDDYLIFYQVDDDKQTVSVFRILHGSRNILSILKHR